MKTIHNKIKLLMLVLFLYLFFYNPPHAQAEVSYLGEVCIWKTDVLGMPPILIWKLGVLYYGDGHFVLNGGISRVSPDVMAPVYGTGELDITGNTFVATLVSSLVDAANTFFTVSHLVINLDTGGGTGGATATEMTFDLTQPTAQSKVTTVPIYVTVCTP